MPDSLRRLAPLTAIPFAILLAITFNEPNTPSVHASGVSVINSYQAHHNAHLLGDICGAFAVVFLVFFVSALRSFFRANGEEGLGTAMFAGGLFIAMGGAIFTCLDLALIDARHQITPQAVQALNVLSNDFFIPFSVGLVVFSLCAGFAVLASKALPKWLGWVQIAIGVVSFTPVGFFAFFGTMVWTVIVAILIYRRSRPAAVMAEPAPAAA